MPSGPGLVCIGMAVKAQVRAPLAIMVAYSDEQGSRTETLTSCYMQCAQSY